MMRSILLALTFVMGVSGLAQAQDVALISVARKTVQPDVIQVSAVSPVTADMIVFGDEKVVLTADIGPSDFLNPDVSFWFNLYVLDANNLPTFVAGGRFVGAADNPPGAWVGLAVDATRVVGRRVRLELDVATRMSLGGSVDLSRTTP